MCRRRSLCFWWPPRHSALTTAAGSIHCGCMSLPCSTHSDLHIYKGTMQYFDFFALTFRPHNIFKYIDEKHWVESYCTLNIRKLTTVTEDWHKMVVQSCFNMQLYIVTHLWYVFLCSLCDWGYWMKYRLTWAELHSPIQKRWFRQTFPKTCSSISDLRIKYKIV